METPKLRNGSLTAPQKQSPAALRTPQKAKTSGPNSAPKVAADRRSPRTLSAEKKKPGRVSQLEAQVVKLGEELHRAKEQLSSIEASKRKAEMEAEEAKKQLRDVCESEVARVRELRQLSHERDKAWKSELEAMERHHSMDSAALASAMAEVQRLKAQLEGASESAYAENQSLRFELAEKLKEQLQAVEAANEELRSECERTKELYESLQQELELSKNRAVPSEELRREVEDSKMEARDLRAALEAAEASYRDEYIKSTLEIRNAYDIAEHLKSESAMKESELEGKLKESRDRVEELSRRLIERENSDQNPPLGPEIKASLGEKERQIETLQEENAALRSEISEKDAVRREEQDKARETAIKLGELTEVGEKGSKRAARLAEELYAAQEANGEMEAELRRLKVQSDQWRKAAEAAASMLCSDGNDRRYCLERAVSSDYRAVIGGRASSPASDDVEEGSPRKKNGSNVLRKIGGLLKKGQK